MNVVFESSPVVEQVSFDPRSNEIHAFIAGIEHVFPLSAIPEEDFESVSSIVGFAIGCEGAVVVCKHREGSETCPCAWLWLKAILTFAARMTLWFVATTLYQPLVTRYRHSCEFV